MYTWNSPILLTGFTLSQLPVPDIFILTTASTSSDPRFLFIALHVNRKLLVTNYCNLIFINLTLASHLIICKQSLLPSPPINFWKFLANTIKIGLTNYVDESYLFNHYLKMNIIIVTDPKVFLYWLFSHLASSEKRCSFASSSSRSSNVNKSSRCFSWLKVDKGSQLGVNGRTVGNI